MRAIIKWSGFWVDLRIGNERDEGVFLANGNITRDGNEAGFFGYPSRLAPNGMGFKFNERIWDGYEIFFLTWSGFKYCPIPPRPAPFTYKINFKF